MMSVQQILQGESPELRQSSSPVTEFDQELDELLENLKDTLQANRGLGLSAPQVGVHKQVVVIDIGQGIEAFINPKIIASFGQVSEYESCLSFPDYTLKVSRPQRITVDAHDDQGHLVHIDATDLLARIICHEIDHLNGVLFFDHLSEEDLYSQLLENSFVTDAETESHDAPSPSDAVRSVKQEAIQKAVQEELQLSIDMLSELSWKLVLSLEILKDYEHLFSQTVDWDALRKATDTMDQTIATVQVCIDSNSTTDSSEER